MHTYGNGPRLVRRMRIRPCRPHRAEGLTDMLLLRALRSKVLKVKDEKRMMSRPLLVRIGSQKT